MKPIVAILLKNSAKFRRENVIQASIGVTVPLQASIGGVVYRGIVSCLLGADDTETSRAVDKDIGR